MGACSLTDAMMAKSLAVLLLLLSFFASEVLAHARSKRQSTSGPISCKVCTALLGSGVFQVRSGISTNLIKPQYKFLCEIFAPSDADTCSSLDEIAYMVKNTAYTSEQICSTVLWDCETSASPQNAMWGLFLPPGLPTGPSYKAKIDQVTSWFRVLHLTDVHIDYSYVIGSEADCDSQGTLASNHICCRAVADSNVISSLLTKLFGQNIKNPAKTWGTLEKTCDLPYWTFKSALKYISRNIQVDYIMVTGDLLAHDGWEYNKNRTIFTMNNVTATLKQYFPNTPMYFALGNHEGVPQDGFAPSALKDYETIGPQFLYNALLSVQNINDASNTNSINSHGSYTAYPIDGLNLKLIVLNDNFCSMFNFYGYVAPGNPSGVLSWLVQELVKSEKANERVHIASHIPSGDNYCITGWSLAYYQIIKRFQGTIAEQFYGHTHKDEYQLYFDNNVPFHMNWVSPSLTTWDAVNPAFRVFTMDSASKNVIDVETYTTNLVNSYSGTEPVWYKEYSHREFYKMTDLSPQSFRQLSDNMETDANLVRAYTKNYYRGGPKADSCLNDPKCQKKLVCQTRKSTRNITMCS